MEQKPIITLRNVTKVYHVGSVDVHALRGVDLTVAPGELCCIIGRSGSGKSTLLNLLAGLEPATSGEIIIANKHLERMNQSELILFRQKHVGFIFQSFNLMPYYTALENVAFPLSFRGVPKAVRLRRAKEALKTVGLESHMKHKPSQMSGGQQQRDPSVFHRLLPHAHKIRPYYTRLSAAPSRFPGKFPQFLRRTQTRRTKRPPRSSAAVFLCVCSVSGVRLICRTSPPASAGARSGPWPRPRCAGTARPRARGTRGSDGCNGPRSSGTPDSRRQAPWNPA